MPHVFQAFGFLPEARAALAEIGDFLAARMNPATAARKAAE
jgi:hypothetical protein